MTELTFTIGFIISGFFAIAIAYFHKNIKEMIPILIYSFSGILILYSKNILTLYFFWELSSLTATWLIWQAKGHKSEETGKIYFILHLISGILLIGGISLYYHLYNSFNISLLTLNSFSELSFNIESIMKMLILSGILVNIGFPITSGWLLMAYGNSTVSSGIILSTITTKAALFLLIKMFCGSGVLYNIGLIMILYGFIFSIIEVNIKRILSYNLIAQLGVMIAALSNSESIISVNLYCFNHIIYNSVLFYVSGLCIENGKDKNIFKIPGMIYQNKLISMALLVSLYSAVGLPLGTGYYVKQLINTHIKDIADLVSWFSMFSIGVRFGHAILFNKSGENFVLSVNYNAKYTTIFISSILVTIAIACPIILYFFDDKYDFDFLSSFKYLIYYFVILGSYLLIKGYNINYKKDKMIDTDYLYEHSTHKIVKLKYKLLNKIIEFFNHLYIKLFLSPNYLKNNLSFANYLLCNTKFSYIIVVIIFVLYMFVI